MTRITEDTQEMMIRIARKGAPASWRRYDELSAVHEWIPNELCDTIAVSISTARAALEASQGVVGERDALIHALESVMNNPIARTALDDELYQRIIALTAACGRIDAALSPNQGAKL